MSATVKAFMSRPGEGPFFLDGDVISDVHGQTFENTGARDDVRAAQWAENEARAILANTESAAMTQGVANRHYRLDCLGYVGPLLAESLARFIEEPIQ